MTTLTGQAETAAPALSRARRQARAQEVADAYARAVVDAAREGRDLEALWDALCANVGVPAASLFVAKALRELGLSEHTFIGEHPLPGYSPTLPAPDQAPPHPYTPGHPHLCQCTCTPAAR